LEAEVTTKDRELNQLKSDRESAYERGLEEGLRQAHGALLAEKSGDLNLVGLQGTEDGVIRLLAASVQGNHLFVGARYELELVQTGASRGVVEIESTDSETGIAYLVCVQKRVAKYWEHLQERALYDASSPPGVRLVPTRLGELSEKGDETQPGIGREPSEEEGQ
jgi:hypothetical protein